MPVIQHTRETFAQFIAETYGDPGAGIVMVQILPWILRGDHVAIYQNQDLGHPDLGEVQLASYGSPQALLEDAEPPQTLPDIRGNINFRYQLIGTYK